MRKILRVMRALKLKNATFVQREFKRNIPCWRFRKFKEHHECRVTSLNAGGVRLEFDLDGIDISAEAAEELAFCLSEAVEIAADRDFRHITGAVRDEGLFERDYRLWDGWSFMARGIVPVENVSPGLMEQHSDTTLIRVQTIEDGGFEIEFEWMGYTFVREHALWLQEALLGASGRQLKNCIRRGLLTAVGIEVLGRRRDREIR